MISGHFEGITTIALFACAIAAAPARAQQPPAANTQTQTPASQLPDEWKFKKEKESAKEEPKQEPAKESPKESEAAKKDAAPPTGARTRKDDKQAPTPRQAAAPMPKAKAPWRGWTDRAIVSLNGGWQSASFDLQDRRELAADVPGDRERRTMTAEYAVESGVALDLGGIVRVWKGLGAGVGVTRFKDARDVAVNGTVPHPFFFDRPRAVSGAVEGAREEIGVHVGAVWVVPLTPRLHLALFGGPAFYRVTQTVVTDFSFSESYPYDEALLTRLASEEESLSATGFSAGADLGYAFTRAIGVGGIVRFGRASVDSRLGSLDVGGPQVGVGLRIRIR